MKVEVEVNELTYKEVVTYPCIMKSIHNDLIVWFNAEFKGTVLRKQAGTYVNPGETYVTTNMKDFEPFHGEIKIIC